MTFLLMNWKLVLIAALVASNALTFKLWREEAREYAVFKAGVVVLGQEMEKHAKKVEADNAKTTKEIKDAIPKQIAAARSSAVRNYIASLPVDSSGGDVSCPPNRAGGTDATGKEPVAACRATFIEDCAQDAAAIGLWQDWARRIGFPVR